MRAILSLPLQGGGQGWAYWAVALNNDDPHPCLPPCRGKEQEDRSE
jgi:hypothetical protein